MSGIVTLTFRCDADEECSGSVVETMLMPDWMRRLPRAPGHWKTLMTRDGKDAWHFCAAHQFCLKAREIEARLAELHAVKTAGAHDHLDEGARTCSGSRERRGDDETM